MKGERRRAVEKVTALVGQRGMAKSRRGDGLLVIDHGRPWAAALTRLRPRRHSGRGLVEGWWRVGGELVETLEGDSGPVAITCQMPPGLRR